MKTAIVVRPYETLIGQLCAALIFDSSPSAAQHHDACIGAQRDAEARAKKALDAKAHAKVCSDDAKEADRKHREFLDAVPFIGSAMLEIATPPPTYSTVDEWDPGSRCDELIEWLSTGGDAGKRVALKLGASRADRDAAAHRASDAIAESRLAAQAFGTAKIRLHGIAKEAELFLELHSPEGWKELKSLRKAERARQKAAKARKATADKPAPGAVPA